MQKINTKEEIKKEISIILNEMGIASPKVVLDVPAMREMGDYSTNVAMLYGKELNMKSLDLAEEIKKELESKKILHVSQIKTAPPGFINLFFDAEFFTKSVSEASDKKYGKNENLKDQKIIVEYTDPNPFKEFHIGHLMSNTIGESISRIIENEGAEVKRLSYGGDVGLHVAKAVYGVLKKREKIEEIKKTDDGEQLKFWSSAYVFGSTQYEENEEAKKEIDDLNKIIFDGSDKEINKLYKWGREVSISHFQEMFKILGTDFDKNFWESEVVEDAMSAVSSGLDKKILEKSDGAIIFRGEEYGLHTRVFVNSKGIPTYEAKELGLGMKKYQTYTFDKSIVITGNEQNDYFNVLLKVMDLLKPEVANKTIHMGHGMLRFATGKMSSRKGNVILANDLIEQIKEKIFEKMKDREMDEDDKQKIAEIVAIGALKFSVLKQAVGKDIIFDIEKSISFEGDSGPYLQYATVRAKSILKKSNSLSPRVALGGGGVTEGWQTTNLEKMIERYPSMTERAGKELAPQYIVTYLTELAGEFNSFYANHKIIDETDPTSSYKLALTESFANIMTLGLNLLGIKVPSEM
jgi:arginyl-tRNA synthetase